MKRRLREDPFGWRSASQLGQLQLAWSSPEWVGLATALWQSAGRYPDAHGIFRPERSLQGAAAEGGFGANLAIRWPESSDRSRTESGSPSASRVLPLSAVSRPSG